MHAVRTRELTKVYAPPSGLRRALMRSPIREPITAVDSVDLDVEVGEVFGVLGPNGAGKTTLFKMLTTLLMPTSGSATVGGYDLVTDDADVRRSIGLVSGDERSFQWRLSGRQNLNFYAALAGVPSARISSRVHAVLEAMRLSDAADNSFYSYSSGMRQRMCIARALLGEPSVLFLDEPTRNVDALTAADLKDIIRTELSGATGRTVLLATHRMEEAEQLCDRIAILRKGAVVFRGTVAELRAATGGRQQCVLRLSGLGEDRANEMAERLRLRAFSVDRPTGNGLVEMRFAYEEGDPDLSFVLADALAGGARVISCDQRERRLEEMFIEVVGGDDAPR